MKNFCLAIGLCLLLMGCNSQSKEDKDELIENRIALNMSDVLYLISEESRFETTFIVDRDYLVQKFDYDLPESVEVMGLFGSALDTDRLLLFKVVNKTDKASLLTYLSILQDIIQDSYPNMMSAEKEMIDQAIILDKGYYVMWITGAGAQDGSSYFDNLS